MLISTRGRYALRIMIELSRHDPEKFISLPVIAFNQGVSEKYLESIISSLVKEKMVEGLRGKGGGYRLCRKLDEYSVGEILRLTEGSLAPVSCPVLGAEECPRADHCSTLPVWLKLDKLINDYLDSVKLSDLIAETTEKCP